MKNLSLKFRFSLLLVWTIISSISFAQSLTMEQISGLKARNIGPAGMSGRVTAIDVVTENPSLIFVGTASGGVWKSESGGVSWEPIFDNQDFASVGALTIDQNATDIIWVGTGEGNPRNSQSSGNGIYKSMDGGKTWNNMGLQNSRNIHRIIIDPRDSKTIYVGVQGSAWGPSEERGLFKTTDGGKTWNKILYINTRTGVGDLIIDPSNPNKLFVNMWQFERQPWFFKSGGEGSGLYVTYDGGENFQLLKEKNGLPKGELGRIGLGISPNNPKVVYALVESKHNALYRSEDGGHQFKMVADKNIGGRPFYYGEIHIDPENENRLYNLHSLVDVSNDGGKTFKTMMPYAKAHPDHHAWYIHPTDGSFIIDGNDGGLTMSRDRGKTWRFIRNLPLAQFYHINYDMETPYNVYGGMQDNGSWRGPSQVYNVQGIQNVYWQELSFGDGFDVIPDRTNSRYGFTMSQQGNVMRYDLETGFSKFVQPVHPDGIDLRFNWNAAIAADPFDEKGLYFGSQFLHKSSDRGDTWIIISPDLTTNDSTKQKSMESGGLTFDATGAENFTTIISIAPSPLNKNVIWVGTDDGNLQLTTDGGKNWVNKIGNIKGLPAGSWIPQIHPSTYNEGEAFVVINDYRRDNWEPYIFHTKDFGKKWTNILSKEKVKGYALSFVQDPEAENLYFVGTESGLYLSIDAGKTYSKFTNKYPTVSTMDMRIHPRENDLIIGTFGRAAYIIDNIQPLRELAKEGVALLDKPVYLFPIPSAEMNVFKQPPGMRFGADGLFYGENKAQGAMISFIANPVEKVKDSVLIEVFDAGGELMTKIRKSPKTGINRFYWRFNKKGVRFPNQAKPKNNLREPRGGSVLPGDYLVKLSYNGQTDSTKVNVEFDHRLEYRMEDLLAREALQKEMNTEIGKATAAADKVRDALEVVQSLSKVINPLKGDENKELKDLHEKISKQLDAFAELLEQPKVQGIFRDKDGLVNVIRQASWGLMAYSDAPGLREELAMKKAKEAIQKYVGDIDAFFSGDWENYQSLVGSNNLNFFSAFEK
ncbi:MAG: hypothetical protein J7J72_08785 [Bacteroidales bacterium]|nr:hypothetical protein [Bacteroidales bacterium]